MATSSPWRQRLLGSLQGQLQLATYLAVFLGFSGASIAGLWLTQRHQANASDAELRANARSLERCLLAEGLLEPSTQTSPAARAKRQEAIRQELRWHSTRRHLLWIERPNGELLLPAEGHLAVDPRIAEAASKLEGKPGLTRTLSVNGMDYIAILNRVFPSGLRGRRD